MRLEIEHDHDQGESRSPGHRLAARLVVVAEDRERNRAHGLRGVPGDRLGRRSADEEERCRLAGGPRDREGRAGHDPADGRRENDLQHRAPLGDAKCVTGLAEAVRDERKHFHGRPRDQREHHDRERKTSCPGARTAAEGEDRDLRGHEEPVDEDPDHDRGEAVQDVEVELDLVAEALRRELADPERRQDTQRDRDHRGDHDEHQRADDRRGDAAAQAAELVELGPLSEEMEAQRR